MPDYTTPQSKVNYRKIWESHYGPIPKDECNRSYEIHHIDGNRNNNNHIDNLKCVSIQEHYDIHYSQKDWHACVMIAAKMKKSPELISQLSRQAQLQLVKAGTHSLLKANGGSEKASRRNYIRYQNPEERKKTGIATKRVVEEGRHNFTGGELQRKRVQAGTHNFLGGEIQKRNNIRRVKEGTHEWLGPNSNQKRLANGTHPSQIKLQCPHCGLVGW